MVCLPADYIKEIKNGCEKEGDAVGLHYRNPGRQSQPEDAYATGMTADPVMPA
ncbi:MAG TPA: hypothetical protein PLZ53_00230 [Candidatus Hydrogenedentes bacterium]|jgi:hypothetical protein|nr:hypothetical protein [Candidatus Hydrogenedentota bacterium]HOD94897.1 hypothetical protein [Candidatus Hydrogenedentota bacterium]HOH41509.1 hypothetical protein [Candidatus Hydrogenedentota bacterium]HOM47886.1 hypothetical protein [Candidatus Hydrogenedentota bacterium]HOR50341.1 hypothetical protein [Candidatus Hydrogenedentota bacterium]